ncbi:MAG: hypothetical protein HGA42_19765, partial [Nostocales cyanobacterium W4_Combined_metabat2_030]|nr:hypothetical protein [Nostocales cyanobacterium W4_Combined_metabat2_030]
YNNGKTIDKVNDDTQWKTTSKGAYCTYNLMNDADSIATFGYLYNWHAVNTGNLAPTGWHVPTEADWDLLYNYLFSNTNRSQTTLFEVGTLHWEAPNSRADNSTGFTAIPSGYRDYSGSRFMNMNTGANYWSSTMNQSNGVCYIYLTADDPEPHISLSGNENFGFAVRCIKD